MDSPSRGTWLDHRSPRIASGLTRSACRTAIEMEIKEKTTNPSCPSKTHPLPTGQDSCRRADKIVDAGQTGEFQDGRACLP